MNPVLKANEDNYAGMIIHPSSYEDMTDEEFIQSLQASLVAWKADQKRGIWLKIPATRSVLVPSVMKFGFTIHHAKGDYIMMTTWLHDTEPNHLPPYAGHFIGVGGFVVNDRDELLVIQERFNPLGMKHWKLPGGHKDPGETIGEGAVRETLEETGIQCEFVSVICFRHMTSYRFGCDDIYFVCHLRPLTDNITIDKNEIANCKWISLDEYLTLPIVHTNRLIVEYYRKQVASGVVMSTDSLPHYRPGNKDMSFYHLSSVTKEQNIPKL